MFYIRWWKPLQAYEKQNNTHCLRRQLFINQGDWATVIGQISHHPTSILRVRKIDSYSCGAITSKLAHVAPKCSNVRGTYQSLFKQCGTNQMQPHMYYPTSAEDNLARSVVHPHSQTIDSFCLLRYYFTLFCLEFINLHIL